MKDSKGKGRRARAVEIPGDRPLTVKEYVKLRDHAYNSALWNVTHYSRTVKQVQDKLREKGYGDGELRYVDSGGVERRDNVVQGAISLLQEQGFLDDGEFVDNFTRSKIDQGWGLSRVRMELLRRGAPRELVDGALAEEEFALQARDALLEEARKCLAHPRAAVPYKGRQWALQRLARKGFPPGEIFEAFKELEELGEAPW